MRTACGIAQGLAFGAGLPVLPVVTLEAMAEAGRNAGAGDDLLTLLDARMGEVYWAQYRYRDGWQVVLAPALSLPRQVAPQGRVAACGNGLTAFADEFSAHGLGSALPQIVPHARDVARLAQLALARGRGLEPQQAQPLYLRNRVALTTLERQAQGRA